MRYITVLLASLFLACPFSLNAEVPRQDDALAAAVSFMGDGGDGTGVWLSEWLRARGARYEFSSAISGKSARRIESAGTSAVPVIMLNENLKASSPRPAYYAVLIAGEAAEFIYLAVPESAEKRYMVCAAMAEVYFELYGTRLDLPVIGGVTDEETAFRINTWVWDGADSGPAAIAREGRYKTLATLASETKLALEQAMQDGTSTSALNARLASILRAQAYYDSEFTRREKGWWTLYQPR
ncbi:MAG: hypothetical protein NDI60_09645 [Elusimicrobiales bacterium]|nr:hypothetical protein [Elusimicrobiales bacterium]